MTELHAPNANDKARLVKRIAWRLQVQAEGDLSERARRRAVELANDTNLRLSPAWEKAVTETPELPEIEAPCGPGDARLSQPSTILLRVYKGESLQVLDLAHGLEIEGAVYPSLSAVATSAALESVKS